MKETKQRLIILLITFTILISTTFSTKSKMKQIPDFMNDPDIEAIIEENDPSRENVKTPYNNENEFEDLNFLENRYLLSNGTAKAGNSTKQEKLVVDLTKNNVDFSGWFGVSHPNFNDPRLFPMGTKALRKVVDFTNLSEYNFLINKAYIKGADPKVKNELMFFFRFKNGFIYFTNSQKSMSVISAIKVDTVKNSDMINNKINPSDTCFEAIDVKKKVWTLCSQTIQEKKKWLCSLEKYFKENMDSFCGVNNEEKKLQANSTAMFSDKLMNNTKKMFIIPRESNKCNEEWNYEQNGTDWECTCSEGLNQSPVNLPSPSVAEASHIKPLFIYDVIEPVTKESSVDGILRENETLKIFNKEGMLRIVSSKFGRIVLADGGVFNAEEIVFHTPAEHMINGKRFDMEIQIIHYGVSKGDIAKQVVLSFLFYMKPGVFNDFLDKIDVYNLPNEIDKFKDLYSTLNIPSIFYSSVYRNPYYDTDKIPMKDFSFYSYDGSLTFPPCTERTTVIVAGEPLPISHTFVELFKEALRKPEFFGVDGKLHQGDEKPKLNSRNVQPLNGRKISFYQSQIHGLD